MREQVPHGDRLHASFASGRQIHDVPIDIGIDVDLYLTRLGRPKAAARAFRGYLRSGAGPLEQQARHGLIKAHRARRDDEAEAKAIRDYLEHHGRSGAARRLRDRLDTLETH